MIKKFQLIQDYVNLELVVRIVVQYDCEVLFANVINYLQSFNTHVINIEPVSFVSFVVLELGIFGSLIFIEEVILGLIKANLSPLKL
jgi:hypothetical protein